jgi:serine/threonine protein kinase
MTPTFILPEVKSRRIGRIAADIKGPSIRPGFRERLRNLIRRRSSTKVKSRGIGRIAMDIEEPTPRLGFRERLRDLCHRRRSREGPIIDQSYESNLTLERDFLEKKYLRILYGFGYKFGEKIGDGKYGIVYECFFTEDTDVTDHRFGNYVVMTRMPLVCKKVVIPEDSDEEKLEFVRTKLNPEKLALTLARHPNIIGLQNIWSNYESFDDEFPTFVLFFMERAEGDLWQYLEDREKDLGRPIDEQEVKLWFKMILSGLQYLHSISIAHLDLKPENILYVRDPLKPHFQYVAKITDFGMSYFAKKDRLIDLFHGTPEFVAPEIIECCVRRQIERYDPFRADIFSLGLVLRYMCAFNDYQIVSHPQMPQTSKYVYISLELLDLLMQLTRVSPNQRPTAEQITTFEWLRE